MVCEFNMWNVNNLSRRDMMVKKYDMIRYFNLFFVAPSVQSAARTIFRPTRVYNSQKQTMDPIRILITNRKKLFKFNTHMHIQAIVYIILYIMFICSQNK